MTKIDLKPPRSVVLNLGYAYPRGYAKASYGVRENILRKLEPALIVAPKKILPRIEVLACQIQAQSSY
jgi:hypothetical protein